MKVLLTGFEPFGGEEINPSWEAVRRVTSPREDIEIHTLQIPVEYFRSAQVLSDAMDRIQPDAVICVGQAGGRSGITPERVAINLDDAASADNAGVVLCEHPIVSSGPAAYFSTLPLRKITQALAACDIPASISLSAGAYVCNHLMYSLLHRLSQTQKNIAGGFIHVPYLPEQVTGRPGTPSLPLETIVKALEIAVLTTAEG